MNNPFKKKQWFVSILHSGTIKDTNSLKKLLTKYIGYHTIGLYIHDERAHLPFAPIWNLWGMSMMTYGSGMINGRWITYTRKKDNVLES